MNSSNADSSSSSAPVKRREFVKVLAAGGAGALLGGCEVADQSQPSIEEPSVFFKDTSHFMQHGTSNLESRLEHLGGFITPIEHFFVRNNSRSIQVDVESYQLEVSGDAVDNALTLSYETLLNMPSRTVFSYLECGGNQRSFFGAHFEQPARGTQWGRGGVGMAVWTGVPLRHVLEQAGIQASAVDVQLIGLDADSPEGGFRRPIPIDKAMDLDTILAYRMNGSLLPLDHGFPLRAIVPGWVGSSNIKWLGRIEVSSQRIWSRNTTTSYVLVGDEYEEEGQAKGKIATLQSIKSTLILPWPATLKEGKHVIRGYAYSPHEAIASVTWSDDGGSTWQEAAVLDPRMKYAWSRFEFEWDAKIGSHSLTTRATDEEGNTQPDSIPYNEKGYLFNLPLNHPIQVS